VSEGRRLEALRRLDLDRDMVEPDLDDLVELCRRLLGAEAAALTMVDAARAWPIARAGRPGTVELPRSASLAARVLDAPEGHVRIEGGDAAEALAAHPWTRGVTGLTALAAAAVRAPDGAVVGALELAWSGTHPGEEADELLPRVAAQLERWLELRAEASEYRRFVELAPDAMVVLDLEGGVERCNPAFAELLGVGSPTALRGRSFLDLVAPEHRDRVAAELARVLFARRRVAVSALAMERSDGTQLPVEISVGHLRGPRRSLQLVVRDQTERVRADAERARLNDQLAEAHRFETVGQLAGGLAHDLNNLLTVFVSNLGMAEETLQELWTGEDREAGLRSLASDLGHLRAASDRVDVLTRKLLQFAARDHRSGRRVSLGEVAASLEELLRRTLGTGVELVVVIDPATPDVELDPGELEQAVTNLLLNGRDAMPDGGQLTLRIGVGELASSHGDPPRSAATVEVEDAGEGMTDAVLARAFEPLFTTKGAERGTGLGLSSVRSFVQRIGGTVRVDTAPGHGTRVTLTLPADTVPVAAEAAGSRAPLVLLVDPADRSRRVIASMLERAGYRVAEVGDATAARGRLAEGGVALLACELVLPDGGGLALVHEARQVHGVGAAVLLSSNPEARDAIEAIPVLVKPFSSDRLLQQVERSGLAR
jgi:PAS domain S-box-containing protein